MSGAPVTVDQSYAYCRQRSRRSRSSFWLSFWLLPGAQHRAMEALYAFSRHTDDLGDSPLAPAERAAALREWRAAFDRALAGAAESLSDPEARRLLPAVVDTVTRFHIPPEHLHAIIDGQEMDLTQSRYETFDELAGYCEKVASAVGWACLYIWGFRDPVALEPARRCGLAFQLTNILRDLREDLRRDRVYLPLADLRACGYSVEELQQGRVTEDFERLMRMEIGRTAELYRAVDELLPYLEPAGRRIFGMMCDTYRRLLGAIARDPGAVLVRRVRLSRWEKLRIAARWFFAPLPRC